MNSPLLSPTTDILAVFADIPEADRAVWRTAADFGASIRESINEYWEKAEYPVHLVKEMGRLGLLSDALPVPNHTPVSHLANGLAVMELARADGSVATAVAVQAGLAMRAIAMHGSQEQIDRWVAPMAAGDIRGAFALTEPDHGSDSIALETTATQVAGGWKISGQKRWIGQGHGADISVVFARMDDGNVGGFIVPQDSAGYESEEITGKVSLRAIPQALITMTDVFVPDENRLPGINGFRDVGAILSFTRVSVSWMSLGHAVACYEAALEHVQYRSQFGRPLSHSQIIQQRLADMAMNIATIALVCRRLAELTESGTMIQQQASLAKVHSTRLARAVAADARDMLGGSGILLENHVIRHMADMEALHTYEGTDTVQSLILGKYITGVGAFR